MNTGSELHYQHGRAVFSASCLRFLAFGLLLAALVLLAIYFTNQLL